MTVDAWEPTGFQIKFNSGFTSFGPGVAIPANFQADLELRNGVRARLEVEVADRVARCVAVTLRGESVKGGVRWPVQRWMDYATVHASSVVQPSDASEGVFVIRPPSTRQERETVEGTAQRGVRRRRSKVDLERVAAAYRDGKVHGVISVFNTSEAQAYRYIRQARQSGVLEPKGEA